MRRKECEITNRDEILEVMKKCGVCHLAFHDGEYPYIVPMNFGVDASGDAIVLYFHCAHEGKKLDLMKENPKVGFAMETAQEVIVGEIACKTSSAYESVVGTGSLTLAQDDEKTHGLQALMNQYSSKHDQTVFLDTMVAKVAVLKLVVHTISGKRDN